MTKTRLLIVEDDEDIRTQMKWALGADYEVSMAGDRGSALAAFAAQHPVVTLLDLGVGLLFVTVWLALVEPSPRRAVAWIVALLLLGNVVTLVYLLSRTCRARQLRDLFLPPRSSDWR